MEVKSKTEKIFDHPLNIRAYCFNIQMIEFKQYFGGEGQDGREERKRPELNKSLIIRSIACREDSNPGVNILTDGKGQINI